MGMDQVVDIFYLDASKVFGRVSHSLLPEKLLCDRLDKVSVQWEGTWLPGCPWRVVVISSFETHNSSQVGSPWGRLGPTLCDIFMWKWGSSVS